MNRARLIAATAVVVVAVALISAWPQPVGFRAWIAEVRDGDEDWGWNLLSADVHRAYDEDPSGYVADMAAADWPSLVLGDPVDVWSDDGFVQVVAELRSEPATVPSFLLDRGIVHGVCNGSTPVGLGVYEDRRLFRDSRFGFGAGGLTGGQARCNASFAAAGG